MKNLKITRGVFYPLEIEVILEVLRDDLKIEEAGNGHFALSGGAERANINSIIEFDIGNGLPEETLATAVYLNTTYGRFVCSFGCDGGINSRKVIYTILGIISQMCKPDFKLASAYKQALFSACEEAEKKAHEAFQKAKEAFSKRTEQVREAIAEGLKTKREAQELLGVYTHVKDTFDRSRLPSIYNWKHQWADPTEDKLYFEK